jgi:hypothetical protein
VARVIDHKGRGEAHLEAGKGERNVNVLDPGTSLQPIPFQILPLEAAAFFLDERSFPVLREQRGYMEVVDMWLNLRVSMPLVLLLELLERLLAGMGKE